MEASKAKSLNDEILLHRQKIERLKLVQRHFPEVEWSFLENGVRAFISVMDLSKTTSVHFYPDAKGNHIFVRPFVEIKRKNKNIIRVYGQQSAIISKQFIINMLNKFGQHCRIADLPDDCQKVFGEVFSEAANNVGEAVAHIVNNIK